MRLVTNLLAMSLILAILVANFNLLIMELKALQRQFYQLSGSNSEVKSVNKSK
jgi:hypothetical protein